MMSTKAVAAAIVTAPCIEFDTARVGHIPSICR